MQITPLLLAGGTGSRLWPLSQPDCPKSLLALTGAKTQLQETWLRVRDHPLCGAPLVVTRAELAEETAKQLTAIGCADYQLLLEPEGRNTGPAILAGALTAQSDRILVLPCDHQIQNEKAFHSAITQAAALENALCLFGIKPGHASSDYGYILCGAARGDGGYDVAAFHEKPDPAAAQRLITSGNAYWNSGIFLLHRVILLQEAERLAPEMLALLRKALTMEEGRLGAAYLDSAPCAFDRLILEHTDKAVMITAAFDWCDLGSYQALWEGSRQDANGNAGDGQFLQSRDNLVVVPPGIIPVLIGAEGLVVVERGGYLMVAKREALTAELLQSLGTEAPN